MKILSKMKGFTLAEVLITLTIIGVVAALTIPSLMASTSEKTYVTKRRGLATRMAQAVAQIDAINAYEDTTSEANANANSAMNFVTGALSKAYKISNVCEFKNFAACDFPATFGGSYGANKVKVSQLGTLTGTNPAATADVLGGLNPEPVAIKTKNGESLLLYYNPRCIAKQTVANGETKNFAQEICVHMFYDLDGAKKGPNKWSYDIGVMSVLYSDNPVLVWPHPDWGGLSNGNDFDYAMRYCLAMGEKSDGGKWILSSLEDGKSRAFAYVVNQVSNALNYTKWTWTTDAEGESLDDYGYQIRINSLEERKLPRSSSSETVACTDSIK